MPICCLAFVEYAAWLLPRCSFASAEMQLRFCRDAAWLEPRCSLAPAKIA